MKDVYKNTKKILLVLALALITTFSYSRSVEALTHNACNVNDLSKINCATYGRKLDQPLSLDVKGNYTTLKNIIVSKPVIEPNEEVEVTIEAENISTEKLSDNNAYLEYYGNAYEKFIKIPLKLVDGKYKGVFKQDKEDIYILMAVNLTTESGKSDYYANVQYWQEDGGTDLSVGNIKIKKGGILATIKNISVSPNIVKTGDTVNISVTMDSKVALPNKGTIEYIYEIDKKIKDDNVIELTLKGDKYEGTMKIDETMNVEMKPHYVVFDNEGPGGDICVYNSKVKNVPGSQDLSGGNILIDNINKSGKLFEITSLTNATEFKIGNCAKVTVRAKNITNKTEKVSLILGLFDNNNKLVHYMAVTQEVEGNTSVDLTGLMGLDVKGEHTIRAFVWDSLERMNSYSNTLEFKVCE